ncbi:hypothetical protein UCRNP2_4561 [Neofusicoccum parvum UCRNP2]|uniref:Uncharacterized protein n=1 Tax=Botryosphaeria parva (strain UCR-NP2) TaxID=1287680 RepID=R1GAT3_BOTPV|nr:hypothetical protein UCRNP2_4561 [Neofusicoccum parvum UCRNP2]
MPSVAGQTALMRLRTALAATPTPRAAAKAPYLLLAAGKENAVPASPLRVRPPRPALRSLERTETEGTIVKMARKEEGEESEVTVAGGSELVQKWVEELPSPKG